MSNFHALELVGRGSDPQFVVGENLNEAKGLLSERLRRLPNSRLPNTSVCW